MNYNPVLYIFLDIINNIGNIEINSHDSQSVNYLKFQ